jgi:outer membrane protein assembly factor BamB
MRRQSLIIAVVAAVCASSSLCSGLAHVINAAAPPKYHLLWNSTLNANDIQASVFSADAKSMYVVTNDYHLVKVNAVTGGIIWTTNTTAPQTQIITIAKGELRGIIAVTEVNTGVTAFVDIHTGKVTNANANVGTFFSGIYPIADKYVAFSQIGGIVAFDETASVLWQASTPGSTASGWAFGDNQIFLTYPQVGLVAYSLDDGTPTWKLDGDNMFTPTSMWFVQPHFLVVSGYGFQTTWAVFDTVTFALLWNTTSIPYWENAVIAVAAPKLDGSGILYAAIQTEQINVSAIALNVSSGNVLWQQSLDLQIFSTAWIGYDERSTVFVAAVDDFGANATMTAYDSESGRVVAFQHFRRPSDAFAYADVGPIACKKSSPHVAYMQVMGNLLALSTRV